MFELIPYMLELDYDSEIRIIEDLEHDDGELPKMMDIVPTIMLNTVTGKKTFTLIKKQENLLQSTRDLLLDESVLWILYLILLLLLSMKLLK